MSTSVRHVPPTAHGLAIILLLLGGIGYPLFQSRASMVLLPLLAAIYGSVWVGRSSWLDRLDRWIRHSPSTQKALLLLFGAVVGHRVPLDDYVENMGGFRRTAEEHGAKIVFLTRPHRETTASMRRIENNWRGKVPEYNDALRQFGEESRLLMIDVQCVFETDYPDGFIDECHFTEEGHQRMAELLAQRLPPLLARSRRAIRAV